MRRSKKARSFDYARDAPTAASRRAFLKVVIFEQTYPTEARQIWGVRRGAGGGTMAKPQNDTHKDYVRYAAHCLERTGATKDQEARSINREMAAEWLKLADAIIHPEEPR